MTSPTFVLRSRRVVTPEGVRPAAVHVVDGTIARVAEWTDVGSAPLEDVGELAVLPGIVDTHVHLNEPGRTEWEGFATATRAAAVGGVTTLVDMPLNSIPPTTTREAFAAKRAAVNATVTQSTSRHVTGVMRLAMVTPTSAKGSAKTVCGSRTRLA